MRTPKWLDAKEVRRWATLRCEHCGHRFRWRRDHRSSFGNRDGKVYHGPCMSFLMWKRSAEERMVVLSIACDVAGLSEGDIATVMHLRAQTEDARVAGSNLVFRVFRDKSKSAQRHE